MDTMKIDTHARAPSTRAAFIIIGQLLCSAARPTARKGRRLRRLAIRAHYTAPLLLGIL
jgi:hypothetical protein